MSVLPPFSDEKWVRHDLPSITTDDFSIREIEDTIKDGDEEVISDLSTHVDFGELTTTPPVIKRLSHYKACELVLVRVINNPAVVTEENNLVSYWEGKYEKLLKKIYNGKVKILDSSYDELDPDEVTKPIVGRIV